MKTQKFYHLASLLTVFLVFQFALVLSIQAQDSDEQMSPELSVAGIELGNRESAENFLKNGYSPRLEEDGSVSYYFYNKWATQVMKLSAPSMDDKYFITEIEVYKVNRNYKERHFHTEEIKYFSTESGIFIGFKQSAMYLIVGVENAGSINKVKPKNLIKIKGEPSERVKTDKKREKMTYKIPVIKLSDGKTDAKYEANYEFYKNKLSKFKVKIVIDTTKLAKK